MMASDTYTKTVEMNESIEMSKSDIKVSKNPFADKHEHASDGEEEDNWSVLSTTISNKLFVTENQRLFPDTETNTDSEDDSSCTSDDNDDESICASNCESTCTEEQELDNAQKSKDLESEIEELEAELEECRCERLALSDDKRILLEEKNHLAKEKHLLLKETNTLLMEKKVLVVEKVNLLETVEKLGKEKRTALAKYNVELSRFKGEHNACINSMQHTIDEKSTLLGEKQRLLEAAEALAEENKKRVASLAWENVCSMNSHNTTVYSMRQSIIDKDILLAEKQQLHNEQLDEMRGDLSEAKISRDAYQEMLRQFTENSTMLKEKSKKMMDDYQLLDGKWQSCGTEMRILEEELKDVKEEVEDVKGNRNSLQGELNDLMIKHDIVEEMLEEAMVEGTSLEDEVKEANKKLHVFYHIFPAVKKYSGDGFQESFMNLEDQYTGNIDMEMLKAYLCSLMVEAEKQL